METKLTNYQGKSLTLTYEGKTKNVYKMEDGNILLHFKDNITLDEKTGKEDPGGNKQGGEVAGIGRACLLMTQHFFPLFEEVGVSTHMISVDLEQQIMIVRPATLIGAGKTVDGSSAGVEVIWRRYATGSFLKHYGKYIPDMYKFETPYIHTTLKDDGRGDPYIDEITLNILGVTEGWEYPALISLTDTIGDVLEREFEKYGCVLIDFKVEFGIGENGEILLIDEISPGTARIYKDGKKLSKQEIGAIFEA